MVIDKHRLLAFEALRWKGFTEQGGNNRGQIVSAFQKAVDGVAEGEPWCMSFVQFCLKHVDQLCTFMNLDPYAPTVMFKSEHCATVWNKAAGTQRGHVPKVGHVVIWKNPNGSNGHTGIVVKVDPAGTFWTVEGNTSGDAGSQSDGDGVFYKHRTGNISAGLHLLGFVNPWLAD